MNWRYLKRLAWGVVLLTAISSNTCTAQQYVKSQSDQVRIPAGDYRIGSDAEERQWGYRNSPLIVRQQQWYDAWELAPQHQKLESFLIDRQPVTQAQFAEFVSASGHRSPYISLQDYLEQGFLVHPYEQVVPYLWQQDPSPVGLESQPPAGLEHHPIVLVSHADAMAYCRWRGLRLPSELEWEAACSGPEKRRFAWGDQWQAESLQFNAEGTALVDAHPEGVTPEGVQDMLGNVFEWTASPFAGGNSVVLKGCSWDDAPGTCRCSFRHGRPPSSRHILIGFRCAADVPAQPIVE
ncbi:MAG: SUMF1/EgtB/PvdO family nonheme iron enzyme [Amphritea sp.]